MPFTTATLVYTVIQGGGASLNDLNTLMALPQVPQDVLAQIGARLNSDVTVSGLTGVTRTIGLSLAPSPTGAATAIRQPNGGAIIAAIVTAPGKGYSAIPLITTPPPDKTEPGEPRGFRGAKFLGRLDVQDVAVVNAGDGYGGSVQARFVGGLQPPRVDPATGVLNAQSCVQGMTIVAQGRGYSSFAQVQFEGSTVVGGRLPRAGLVLDSKGRVIKLNIVDSGQGMLEVPSAFVWDPGPAKDGKNGGKGAVLSVQMGIGTVATATVGVAAGSITGLTIVNAGGPYTAMPQIILSDTSGTPAVVVPLMGLHSIEVLDPGEGYAIDPAITVTSAFNDYYAGSTAAQAALAFGDLMKTLLEVSVKSPVAAATPIVT
jgi:hypothetical protein